MHYRSYRDLSLSISRNLHKIPRGIDLVVGIPRSGMLPATMIGQMLNKPVIALDSYLDGKMYEMGLYRRPANLITRFSELKHVLVMDDSINSGNSMNRCLLYTSDAADDLLCVDLGGRRIIKKKTTTDKL